MDTPVSGALENLLNAGVLGAIVVIFAAVIYALWRHSIDERKTLLSQQQSERDALTAQHRGERDELLRHLRETEAKNRQDLQAAHQARVADSEALYKQMFDVVKQCTSVMEMTASALHAHKDVATEQRDAQKEAAEELRKLSSLLMSLSEEIRVRFRAYPGR
jgi:FlaG/FlaF family flagellin (archaellin)